MPGIYYLIYFYKKMAILLKKRIGTLSIVNYGIFALGKNVWAGRLWADISAVCFLWRNGCSVYMGMSYYGCSEKKY